MAQLKLELATRTAAKQPLKLPQRGYPLSLIAHRHAVAQLELELATRTAKQMEVHAVTRRL